MIRLSLAAARLKRDPYLRMVLAPDGVADGAIVVFFVHAILMVPLVLDGVSVIAAARVILSGMFSWIILSGMVYLLGRHGLQGYGSFPGVMAATSIGFPVLLASLVFAPFLEPHIATLIVSAWLIATVWMAVRVALELSADKAAVAAIGGWVAFVIITIIFRF